MIFTKIRIEDFQTMFLVFGPILTIKLMTFMSHFQTPRRPTPRLPWELGTSDPNSHRPP